MVNLLWGSVAECRVETSGIVAELDIAGYIFAGVFPCRVHGSVDPLDFQCRVERFRLRIIETRSFRPTE